MSTTHQRETPAHVDASCTDAENRNEKGMINLSKKITDNLKSKVKGQVVLPSVSSYDQVRQIWNAMIDRRPALIVDVPKPMTFHMQSRSRARMGSKYQFEVRDITLRGTLCVITA